MEIYDAGFNGKVYYTLKIDNDNIDLIVHDKCARILPPLGGGGIALFPLFFLLIIDYFLIFTNIYI